MQFASTASTSETDAIFHMQHHLSRMDIYCGAFAYKKGWKRKKVIVKSVFGSCRCLKRNWREIDRRLRKYGKYKKLFPLGSRNTWNCNSREEIPFAAGRPLTFIYIRDDNNMESESDDESGLRPNPR